jgi:ubiquinone/menaquinone biosynthesis C-methylase UbiE
MAGGLYERVVFPWLNDALGRVSALRELRQETLSAAYGDVIEIGFGTGANLAHYPPAVTTVVGVEPSRGMTRRAVARVDASPIAVRIVGSVAEDLPFESARFDAAVTTLTLCSVRDPRRVLGELHRVLRPGGTLFVLEHGLSPDPSVARWQQRLNGLQRVVACGCNLNRPVAALVTAAGFELARVRTFAVPGIPQTHGWITAGSAIRQ